MYFGEDGRWGGRLEKSNGTGRRIKGKNRSRPPSRGQSPGGSPGGGEEEGTRAPAPAPPRGGPSARPYQPEQDSPEQGGRGGGQRPLRPHRTAGRPAARRCSAGMGSGSRRGAVSVAGPDGGAWRGLAGVTAVAGAATAAPTSFSGHARSTRKPQRRARGAPSPRGLLLRPGAGGPPAARPGLTVQLPDLNSPRSPGEQGTFSKPSSSKSPTTAVFRSQ